MVVVVVGRLLLLWLVRVLLVGGRLCRTLLSILGAPSRYDTIPPRAAIVIFDRHGLNFKKVIEFGTGFNGPPSN
jgi:hypothetical protein